MTRDSVGARITRSAAAHPEKIAVRAADGQLTFARVADELERLASAVSAALIPGETTTVGMALGRTAMLPVALAAVIHAGGHAVPLDPGQPAARLRHLLEDAAPALTITDPHTEHALGPLLNGRTHVSVARLAASVPSAARRPRGSGGYVLYTSGSTGKPKGVVVDEAALVNVLDSLAARPGVRADDVLLATTTIGFDIALAELLLPLVTGATVVVARPEESRDPRTLASLIATEGATILQATPSLWTMLRLAGWAGAPQLDAWCGGEDLRADLAAFLGPRVRSVWNLYGPTETTIWSTVAAVDSVTGTDGPPLGDPVHRTRLTLVDEDLTPVGPGVEGELLIAGAGLARGYLGRPALTAERFVPDPDPAHPGARRYRTGDRVRRDDTGQLRYLGRRDGQVKVRGARVELGEVEAVLERHADVVRAAVVAIPGGPGGTAGVLLAAAVQLADGAGVDECLRSLHDHVAAELPPNARPARVQHVARFPHTASGKLDRTALGALLGDRNARPQPPSSGDEAHALLRVVVGEVLDRSAVSGADHFLDLGGDSVRAVSVVAALRERGWHVRATDLLGAAQLDHVRVRPAPDDDQRDGPNPLSPTQQGMLFHSLLDRASDVYLLQEVWEVREITAAAFAEGARAVLDELPHLSARLSWQESGTLAFVPGDRHPPVAATESAAADLAAVLAADRAAGVDLERGPLARLTYQPRDRGLTAVLTYHHALLDGWSSALVMGEILHRARRTPGESGRRRPHDRAPAAGDETDAAAQERWSQYLKAYEPLPARPRSADRRGTVGAVAHLVAGTSSAALHAAVQRERITLSAVMAAAWAATLGRLVHDRDDIAIGVTRSGRDHGAAGIDRYVGNTITTLPLRVRLSPADSLRSLCGAVHRDLRDQTRWEHVPLVDVRAGVPGEGALFDAVLVMQNFPVDLPRVADGRPMAELVAVHDHTNYRLALRVSAVDGGGIRLRLGYQEDVVGAATARGLIEAVACFVAAFAADPATTAAAVPLVPAAGRHLREAVPADGPPSPTSLWATVAGHAERDGTHPAVADGHTSLTYGQLVGRARAVDAALRQRGVRRGDVVAVAAGRRTDAAACLLGVWRAGATYLPLDLDGPPDRRRALLAHARPRVLLAPLRGAPARDGAPIANLDNLDNLAIVDLDRLADADGDAETPDLEPAVAVTAADAAYLVATSGSTGEPKVILGTHGALATRVTELVAHFGIDRHDRILQLAPLTFDASFRDLLAPLVAGASVVLAPEPSRLDGDRLVTLVDAHGITALLSTVPALLQRLGPERPAAGSSVRLVVSAGDRLRAGDVRRVRQTFGAATDVVNAFGPSETTLTAVRHHVPAGEFADDGADCPVGQPVAGATCVVVDRWGHQVPPGCPGELWIGGAGLARGYAGRPALTAERFVPDRHSDRPGGRAYRTGDRVRRGPDGALEFLGRLDRQVKVRGHRIELTEVEAALLRHPQVSAAVVTHRLDHDLIAHLVVTAPVTVAALRAHLARLVAPVMVPASFHLHDRLPVTATGKIDRARLAATPATARPALGTAHQSPGSPLQQQIADVWAAVLDTPAVGVHDDFFALGGHSILATRVAGRLRALGLAVDLGDLFEHPTVAALAAVAATRAPAPPLTPIPRRAPQARADQEAPS
jgi:amino acid adenylation domain-containing protein